MKNNFVVISTKVSELILPQLQRICAKKGVTLYDMLQMLCDTIVRYMSDVTNLTEEMERMMQIFEDMAGWKNAFNLADFDADPCIHEALYFIGDEKKNGTRAVMVDRPYFGIWTQTTNIQQILERVINNLSPERYKRLRSKLVKQGYTSVLDMLDAFLVKHDDDDDRDAIRAEFEDCARDDYGKKPSEHRYISRHSKSLNSEAPSQPTFNFSEDA